MSVGGVAAHCVGEMSRTSRGVCSRTEVVCAAFQGMSLWQCRRRLHHWCLHPYRPARQPAHSFVVPCILPACSQGLYKQMVDIMKGLGVDAIDTVGTPFDPEMHEAIMREPNDEVPDGTVIMEFRKGFKMGERMLRPAMVKVSFSEAPTEVSSADTDSEPASIDETSS